MNGGVSTTCEKMDLGVCGSSEDPRRRTIPKPKNLTSVGHLTRKAVRSRNKEQTISSSGFSSWLCVSCLVESHLASLGLNVLICKVEPTMCALHV